MQSPSPSPYGLGLRRPRSGLRGKIQGYISTTMNNPYKPRKVRRLTKDEIIKAKERYRDMWAANRPRMLKLAELGRKAISERHNEHRLWMRQWLAKCPSHFSREQLRRMIDRDRVEGDTAKTESYIKTMIRYGYIKFDDSTMLWENMYFKL